MAKIRLVITASQKEEFLQWLQEEEVLHIAEQSNLFGNKLETAPETQTNYQLARTQFALEFLSRIRGELNLKEKKSWRNMFAGKPTASLKKLEKTIAEVKLDELLSEITVISDKLAELTTKEQLLLDKKKLHKEWKKLAITGKQAAYTGHVLFTIALSQEAHLKAELNKIKTATWQEVDRIVNKKSGVLYFEAVCNNDDKDKLDKAIVSANGELVILDLKEDENLLDYLKKIEKNIDQTKKAYQELLEKGKELLKIEEKLKYIYDALLHREEREGLYSSLVRSPYTYVLVGWLTKKSLSAFKKRLEEAFPTVALEKIKPEKNETPPIVFANSALIKPFEVVTDIYGKPKYNEIDPSPVLSLFFLIGFGLALTDAGYGIIIMIATFLAIKFLRLKKDVEKMMRLLFLGGVATVILGALTGGWFGLVLEDLPVSTLRDILLKIKLIDPVSQPITLLLIVFAIGIVQLLFAWMVKAYDSWRNGEKVSAVLDSLAWVTMVLAIFGWIGASKNILPSTLETPFLWILITNTVVLVLTQGREHKNIFLRLGTGVLSLYGLINFLSDVLSYSRLLALGLATGIIGLVVNLIGGMVMSMIPVIGVVLAIIVLIGGHLFNLGINALGAFIHSGRLQFVEFFPKFMEGGGRPYKPFGRVSKYVDNPNDFN